MTEPAALAIAAAIVPIVMRLRPGSEQSPTDQDCAHRKSRNPAARVVELGIIVPRLRQEAFDRINRIDHVEKKSRQQDRRDEKAAHQRDAPETFEHDILLHPVDRCTTNACHRDETHELTHMLQFRAQHAARQQHDVAIFLEQIARHTVAIPGREKKAER